LLALVSRTDAWRDLGVSRRPVALRSLSEVARKSSVRFPAGALLLDGEFQGGLSQYIVAKVSMPAAEVRQFAAQPIFSRKGNLSGTDRAFTNADEPAMVDRGWNPDACKRFLSGRGTTIGAPEFVRVVIDLDDSKTAIVYLEWSSA
jgi:hypothetical protein